MPEDAESVALVVMEAVGKQSSIFETNKLAENVGASQMVAESTTDNLWDALRTLGHQKAIAEGNGSSRPAEDQCIENGAPMEVIISTSGKALVLCQDRALAENLIWQVSSLTLQRSPGIRVVGAISEFEWGTGLNQAAEEARGLIDGHASEAPAERHLRLPIIEDCVSSGLAASQRDQAPDGTRSQVARSAATVARHAARDRAVLRLTRDQYDLSKSMRVFDECDLSWIAVIHADGNGLGRVFADFGKHLDEHLPAGANSTADRHWVHWMRQLSQATESITTEAFHSALGEVERRTWHSTNRRGGRITTTALVPIILGGDDLSVVCDGASAWAFTQRYLAEFASLAKVDETVAKLGIGLTASAGVAWVKHHYPFSAAHELAAELTASAKTLKPAPAIDFHVLYDSSTSGLGVIRSKLELEGVALYGGPYLNRSGGPAGGEDDERHRQGDEPGSPANTTFDVDSLRGLLSGRDNNGRALVPASAVHRIRQACFESRDRAESLWVDLVERLEKRAGLSRQLFGDAKSRITLLDAMALADVIGSPADAWANSAEDEA